MKRVTAFVLGLLMLHASAAWALEICALQHADRGRIATVEGGADDDRHSPMHEADLHCLDLVDDIGPLLRASGAGRYSGYYPSAGEPVASPPDISISSERRAKAFGTELSLRLLKGPSPHLYLSVLRI
jgi:hypothetical protein